MVGLAASKASMIFCSAASRGSAPTVAYVMVTWPPEEDDVSALPPEQAVKAKPATVTNAAAATLRRRKDAELTVCSDLIDSRLWLSDRVAGTVSCVNGHTRFVM